MTTYPETETVARILARGYNQHTQDHGPYTSAAGEPTQTADGHGLLVVRDGAEYAVRVTRAQAMAAPGPLTPGQCWAALRLEIQGLRAIHYDNANDLTDEGKDAERAFGRVDAYDHVLHRMAQMEADR